MRLIDTPGTNDVAKTRTDKQIYIEVINTSRSLLTSRKQGITTFTQCMMPDKSGRLRKSSFQNMNIILLILNSFHPESNPHEHPRMCVIFNNVSKNPKIKKVIIKYGKFESD